MRKTVGLSYNAKPLSLAEFELFYLYSFALFANNGLSASVAFTHRSFKILALFDGGRHTGLLNLAVKTPQ